MARKQLTLSTPHNPQVGTGSYKLHTMLVDFTNSVASVLLKGDDGRLHRVDLGSVPNTNQENAILSLINTGDLAGTIADAPVMPPVVP